MRLNAMSWYLFCLMIWRSCSLCICSRWRVILIPCVWCYSVIAGVVRCCWRRILLHCRIGRLRGTWNYCLNQIGLSCFSSRCWRIICIQPEVFCMLQGNKQTVEYSEANFVIMEQFSYVVDFLILWSALLKLRCLIIPFTRWLTSVHPNSRQHTRSSSM